MQLLFDSSTEFGEHTGLSLIPGTVKHLSNFKENIRVPNIGWCKLRFGCSDIDPIRSIASYGYFVHSYYATDVVEQHVLATADYMGYSVPAIVGNNNVIGFQFHPEKSGPSGLDLLKRYIG
jgi:glutamine amidotransferase